jgi:hypothetical protein
MSGVCGYIDGDQLRFVNLSLLPHFEEDDNKDNNNNNNNNEPASIVCGSHVSVGCRAANFVLVVVAELNTNNRSPNDLLLVVYLICLLCVCLHLDVDIK